MNEATTVLIALVVLGYVLWSQTRGRPVVVRRLVVLPAVLVVWGLSDAGHAPHPSGALDVGLVALDVFLSLSLGALRGTTVRLSERNGFLYQQGGRATLALWGLSVAARAAVDAVGHAGHEHLSSSASLLPLLFGLTLAAQGAVVAWRGARTGVPFAPRSSLPGAVGPGTGPGGRPGTGFGRGRSTGLGGGSSAPVGKVPGNGARDAWW